MTVIIGEEKPSIDDILHFGVKGMRWGVRKSDPGLDTSEGRKKRIGKLEKKIDRLDDEYIVTGYGLRGHAAKGLHEKAKKKDPNYDATGKTWTKEQNAAFSKKVGRRARRQSIQMGALASAIILGAGNIAMSALAANGTHANTVREGRIGVAMLVGIPAKQTVQYVRAIGQAEKHQRLRKEITELERIERKNARTRPKAVSR